MQFDFFRTRPSREKVRQENLLLDTNVVPLVFKRNPRAKRYILRLDSLGAAKVTIPRYGTLKEARAFAEKNVAWIRNQLEIARSRSMPRPLKHGSEILFRGRRVALEVDACRGVVRFGDQRAFNFRNGKSLRDFILLTLRNLAVKELPPRTYELAETHGLQVRRVSIRNQKTRWGSCSCSRTISLNWRLVQCPEFVRDYIILHELAHLIHMNHSIRFWRRVEKMCPEFRRAERWLKENTRLLEDLR